MGSIVSQKSRTTRSNRSSSSQASSLLREKLAVNEPRLAALKIESSFSGRRQTLEAEVNSLQLAEELAKTETIY